MKSWSKIETRPLARSPSERSERRTILDHGGQSNPAQPSGFTTLQMEFEAAPPACAILEFACPVAKRARLTRPRDVTERNRSGVLPDDGRLCAYRLREGIKAGSDAVLMKRIVLLTFCFSMHRMEDTEL